MSYLVWLVPIGLVMGASALFIFLWSLRQGQYEDLDGAAARILVDEDDRPIVDCAAKPVSVHLREFDSASVK